jgi:hypothetical protein
VSEDVLAEKRQELLELEAKIRAEQKKVCGCVGFCVRAGCAERQRIRAQCAEVGCIIYCHLPPAQVGLLKPIM